MLTGLRASDAPILQRLCGADMRLFLRLGALLQAHLAVTEPALAALQATPGGKALIADRRLQDATAASFPALLAEHAGDSGLALLDEAGGAEPGWRVLAIADEVGNPLLAAMAGPAVARGNGEVIEAEVIHAEAMPALSELAATLAPALRGPIEGLLQARADDQRAAALEQLRYATPPLHLVGEIMPMLLADGAELVRERAISLLVAAGAHIAVVDLIRALQRKDEAALTRLGEVLSTLPDQQRDLAIAALVAHVARGHATPALVGLCQRLAEHLVRFRGLDRLLELLLPTRISLISLVRALQEHDAERVEGTLRRHLGEGAEADANLIVLLAAPGRGADAALIERGVDLLISAGDAPVERMALAGALRRIDAAPGAEHGTLAARLVARSAAIPAARDTSVIWLLAELCRDGLINAADGERLAEALRHWLRDAPGPILVALLEQQLPAHLPASAAARGALVEPLVEIIARFRDERSLDLVGVSLSGIGAAGVPALWQLLEEHPHEPVRLLTAGLLPTLVAADDAAALAAAVKRLLGGLARVEQGRERGALVTAAARLAGNPIAAPAHSAVVFAATQGLGEWGTEALGFLAAGPHLTSEQRGEILEQLLRELGEELPDMPLDAQIDAATQEQTFILDQRLGAHTENIPRVLDALQRIGRSPHLDASGLKRLVERMCVQWAAVSTWRTIWGPGNVQELGRALGLLAGRADFPGPLRIRICEALLPRLSQLVVARSLARAFATGDGPYLSELAGKAAAKLVQLAADKYYADDEWPELAETLIDFLVVPHLGANGAPLRRRLANLVGAYRASCTSRARAKLCAILPDLEPDLRARLDWA